METDQPRRVNGNKPLGIALAALLLGLVLGGIVGFGQSIFRPSPETIATSALQSMRAQNRLAVFVARYVSVVSSKQSQLGGLLTTERTLVLPGDVRYELDLAKLGKDDVHWDAGSKTLAVTLPEIEIAGPDVDLNALREYGPGGLGQLLTNGASSLDQANRARSVADLRKQALAPVPMGLAREAGRRAVEHSFALPLAAAGIEGAQVVARYPTEGGHSGEVIDHSRSYNEVLQRR